MVVDWVERRPSSIAVISWVSIQFFPFGRHSLDCQIIWKTATPTQLLSTGAVVPLRFPRFLSRRYPCFKSRRNHFDVL